MLVLILSTAAISSALRQASYLLTASFRFAVTHDTLALANTSPTGRAENFHLQVIQHSATVNRTAPVTMLLPMLGAPTKTGPTGPEKLHEEQWNARLTRAASCS